VSKRGAMTGGHRDVNRSRMANARAMLEARRRAEALRAQKLAAEQGGIAVDQRVTALLSEVKRLEVHAEHLRGGRKEARGEQRVLAQAEADQRRQLEAKQRLASSLAATIEGVSGRLEALRAELGTELRATLSAAEQRELAALAPELDALRERAAAAHAAATQAAARRAALAESLEANLLRRKAELEDAVGAADTAAAALQLAAARDALAAASAELAELDEAAAADAAASEEAKRQVEQLTGRVAELRATARDGDAAADDETSALNELASRRARLLASQDAWSKRIVDLGAVPSDAIEKYRCAPAA